MLSAVFEDRISTRAGKDSHLQRRTAKATSGLHMVEQEGAEGSRGERRKGSARVFTQAAALSAWYVSAPQETVIRISGAGTMENLKVFQGNEKQNTKPPHEMTNLFSFNGSSS